MTSVHWAVSLGPTTTAFPAICVCRYCPASEETLISDRLPGDRAKLKLKPTCDEWQRLSPLAKGGSGTAQDDRGTGDESGGIAPVRLHQTCTRTTSPLDTLGTSHRFSPQYQTIGFVPCSTWHYAQSGRSQALLRTGTAAHFQALPPKEAIIRDRPPLNRSSQSGPHPPSHLQRA